MAKILDRMKQLFVIGFIAVFFAACSKDEKTVETGVPAITVQNIAYATADPLENMDVYLPAGRTATSTNCVVVIHGGSWSSGDKADMDSALNAFRLLLPNYATFNINYRLANGSTIVSSNQMDDVNAAVNFIVTKASEYKVNANKIIIVGASAGAHLGMLKAYKYNSDGRVKAMIDLFGPTDLSWMYNSQPYYLSLTQAVLTNFMGTTQPANPTLYQMASPINFVSAAAPPTQILHGTADSIVPVRESQRLNVALQTANVTHEFITIAGGGHGTWDNASWTNAYAKMTAFIKTYVP